MSIVHGDCDAKFQGLKDLFQKTLDGPDEVGACITVSVDGKNVVDIWGGYKDEAKTQPWEKDTIINVFSSTKTLISLATFILVDRGLLDPDEKVSKYWPEFAANGKENVLVRHVMSHTSGLSGWEERITPDTLYDFPAASALLAAQAPWFEPGTASGYHAITMGFLLGELVRRVTGKTMKEFVQEEICGPLGADFQIGAKETDWPRICNVIPPPDADLEAALAANMLPSMVVKTLCNPLMGATKSCTAEWRYAEIGAANGHSNSRGMNRALSIVSLGGEVDGKRYLSQATIDRIFEEQAFGIDNVLGVEIRFGMGFGIAGSATSATTMPDGKICYWGGWGGSVVIMDLDNRMTITYAMNKMKQGTVGNPISQSYVRAVYAAIGISLPSKE